MKNKILIIITLVIVILSNVFPYNVFAVFKIEEAKVYTTVECPILLTYNGMQILTSYVVYNLNGTEYPAYCMQVDLPGAGKVGPYMLDTEELLEDEKIWKVIINGYPYKTLKELGAETMEEAYTATKQAVYCAIYDRGIEEYGPVDTEEGERTYEVMKKILKSAENCTEVINKQNKLSLIKNEGKWKADDENKYAYKSYKIESKYNIDEYTVSIKDELAGKAKIIDESGKEKSTFSIDEEFRIKILISNMENTEFQINIDYELDTKPVLIGVSRIPYTQDYALTGSS